MVKVSATELVIIFLLHWLVIIPASKGSESEDVSTTSEKKRDLKSHKDFFETGIFLIFMILANTILAVVVEQLVEYTKSNKVVFSKPVFDAQNLNINLMDAFSNNTKSDKQIETDEFYPGKWLRQFLGFSDLNDEMSEIKLGVISSINETGPIFKTLDSTNCGGIVVADKGTIAFLSQPNFSKHKETRCIWTVRGSRKKRIKFKLISMSEKPVAKRDKDKRDNVITLQSALLPDRYADHAGTIVMDGSTTTEYTLDGPVVFVTLISTSNSTLPEFQLSFQALEDDVESLMTTYFLHYHSDLPIGIVDYPLNRGAEKYNPNEFSTFVVNPKELKKQKHELVFVDIEKSDKCSKDKLYFLYPSIFNERVYARTRNFGWDIIEHCGTPRDQHRSTHYPIIGVFISDDKNEFEGFKFTWGLD